MNGDSSAISYKGFDVPAKYKAGKSDELIVLFHGVIRRDVRKFPAYESFLPVDSHQISLADPALLDSETIISSWFLGKEGADQVERMSEMISDLSNRLGVKRVIFLGGSAGGFAALLYSQFHAGSVAIAVSPQTRLQTYHSKFAVDFRESLWPSSSSFDDVKYANLLDLYSRGTNNFPIIVMSRRDTGHLYHQIFPFVGCLPFSMNDRFVLDVGFWNILGHPNSVPRENYLSWLRAAIFTPELSADALSQIHFSMLGGVDAPNTFVPKGRNFDTQDVTKANLVADYLLRSESK